LTHFSLTYFSALFLLLLVPCFIWCKLKAKIVYFPKAEWLPKRAFAWDSTTIWLMIIYTLLVLSLSQPYSYEINLSSQKKGRDLVIVMDTSGSMAQRGFNKERTQQSKYDISVSLAKDFIKKRLDDNVGLVVFGSFAFTASPLTYDLKALDEMFDLMSDIGIAGTSTAIGDALIQGINTLYAGKAKSKVLILLTDGKHNAGKSSPREAVDLAKSRGIKIYTIGIGKKGDYDKKLLETIAKDSRAKSFFASNSNELQIVYKSIDRLEPSSIASHSYLNKAELFIYPLFLATVLLAILLWREEEKV
jgi:Ca-activated chloride channel family protein